MVRKHTNSDTKFSFQLKMDEFGKNFNLAQKKISELEKNIQDTNICQNQLLKDLVNIKTQFSHINSILNVLTTALIGVIGTINPKISAHLTKQIEILQKETEEKNSSTEKKIGTNSNPPLKKNLKHQ